MLNNITFITKTFLRPDALDECLRTIKQIYPESYIIVADDSKEPKINQLADEYYFLPFDSGLSFGRNFLLSKVKTKYVMLFDDDIIFTKNDYLEKAYSILEKNEDLHLVAGSILGNNFYGTFSKEGEILYRNLQSFRKEVNGIKYYDFVINIFLAETSKVKNIGWDERLKITEHTEFFHRASKEIGITRIDEWHFINKKQRTCLYDSYRVSRIKQFMPLQCKILKVKQIKDRKNVLSPR